MFPVVGLAKYTNDYGDARSQGSHEGNDIMAPRRAIAVATEPGRIRFHTTSSRAGCMLYLYGESGTTYLYIHLNNDLTAGNDNRGKCVPGTAFAPGLKDGQQVAAGEPVGYVGDSGDADGTPHLHFEIHPGNGGPTNPYPYLNRATRLLFAAAPGSTITLSLTGSVMGTATDTLELKVDQLQIFPLGVTLLKLKKPIRLSLPATALVDTGKGGSASLALQLTSSLAGKSVLVLTEPTTSSLAAQSGQDGAFSAARIVLK